MNPLNKGGTEIQIHACFLHYHSLVHYSAVVHHYHLRWLPTYTVMKQWDLAFYRYGNI
jgi:hypothetical protein